MATPLLCSAVHGPASLRCGERESTRICRPPFGKDICFATLKGSRDLKLHSHILRSDKRCFAAKCGRVYARSGAPRTHDGSFHKASHSASICRVDHEANVGIGLESFSKEMRSFVVSAAASAFALVILLGTFDRAYAATATILPLGGDGPFPCENINAYYAPANGLKGPELKEKLHQIIDKHYSLSYSAVWDTLKILDAADEADPLSSPDIIEIYAQRRSPKELASKPEGWNREHLWPRSFGLTEGKPEFTDIHNLRPADINVNSSRGNKFFSECSLSPDQVCVIPANKEAASDTATTRSFWTPPEKVRGDIARALFYMAVRYEGTEPSTINLELSDNPSASEGKMGLLSVLLKWNQLDPPSPSEQLRNSRVCSLIQHNRNPFVDNPQYADLIWGNQGSQSLINPNFVNLQSNSESLISKSDASPSSGVPNRNCPEADTENAWINEFHYTNFGPDQAEFVEVVVGPKVEPNDLSVYFYNGFDQKVYKKIPLTSFSLGQFTPDGYRTFAVMLPTNTIQNGPEDGFALVREGKTEAKGKTIPPSVLQFISYQGVLVAKDGPAQGMKSLDVGVSESNQSTVSSSVGLFGKGDRYGDFKWRVYKDSTFGRINPGQSFEVKKECGVSSQ